MTTSDAKVKQSVERCKYNHEWVKIGTKEIMGEPVIRCRVCGHFPNTKEGETAQSIITLRSILNPGDTVYTILNHVSRSGMNRRISCVIGAGKDVKNITWDVARALGDPVRNRAGYVQDVGIECGGCGMDMGFDLVYNLSRVLFPKVVKGETDGGYALKQRWL